MRWPEAKDAEVRASRLGGTCLSSTHADAAAVEAPLCSRQRQRCAVAACRRLGVLAEHVGAPAGAAGVAAAVGAAGVGGSRATPAEVEQYICDGYVVVSGLLTPGANCGGQSAKQSRPQLDFQGQRRPLEFSPFFGENVAKQERPISHYKCAVGAAVCSAAEDAMWAQMSGPPKPLAEDKWATVGRQRPRRNDAASWGGAWAGVVDGDAILASFSAECMRAAEVLSGAYEQVGPYPMTQHPIGPPSETLAVNVFPAEQGEWAWPSPHTDSGATDSGGAGWRTVPRPVRLQHITYLTGPAPGRQGGGGTVVWPGSHHRLEALWQADNAAYEWMGSFDQHVPAVCADITPIVRFTSSLPPS